jgi:hypothetical protein
MTLIGKALALTPKFKHLYTCKLLAPTTKMVNNRKRSGLRSQHDSVKARRTKWAINNAFLRSWKWKWRPNFQAPLIALANPGKSGRESGDQRWIVSELWAIRQASFSLVAGKRRHDNMVRDLSHSILAIPAVEFAKTWRSFIGRYWISGDKFSIFTENPCRLTKSSNYERKLAEDRQKRKHWWAPIEFIWHGRQPPLVNACASSPWHETLTVAKLPLPIPAISSIPDFFLSKL